MLFNAVCSFALIYYYVTLYISTVSTFTSVSVLNHGETIRFSRRYLSQERHFPSLLSISKTTEELLEYATDKNNENAPIHVVVLGGGVGGLAIASRLATCKTETSEPRSIRVTILEKNAETGGRCGSFDVTVPNLAGGIADEPKTLVFRHERGPSLLLLPQMYQQLFTDVTRGSKVAQDFGLSMKQCVPAYTVVFDDGDRIDLGFPRDAGDDLQPYNEHNNSIQRLNSESRTMMNQFELNGAQKWDDYMRLCRAYLECGLPNFIEERLDLKSFPNFILEGILRNLGQSFPLKPHRDVLDTYFSSEKMCALASFQDLYVGLQPFRSNASDAIGGGVWHSTAPAVFGLLSAIELHPDVGGVFAPIGGFRVVQESLQKLATSYCNVTIQCNCSVVRATNKGVYFYDTTITDYIATPELQFMQADVIVINADLPYAEESLVSGQQETESIAVTELNAHSKEVIVPTTGEQRTEHPHLSLTQHDGLYEMKYDWNDRYEFSSGVIAFHWSLNRSLEDLSTHNVFLSASNRTDAYQSWNFVRNVTLRTSSMMTNMNEPFNFYVHRASKTDPTAAPYVSVFIVLPLDCFSKLKHRRNAFLIGNGCNHDFGPMSNVAAKRKLFIATEK